MNTKLDAMAIDQIFMSARTYNTWSSKPIATDTLTELWDILRMGPTSANCSPARIVFVVSDDAKEKLRPCLIGGNVDKTMSAPATAIIGFDMTFYDRLNKLFPHEDARSWFVGKDDVILDTAFRNGTLQGAYLIIAARALGLDCGPMSGFDKSKVDAAFFAGTEIKSNFLCNLGYGSEEGLFPRNPRLTFTEACRIE